METYNVVTSMMAPLPVVPEVKIMQRPDFVKIVGFVLDTTRALVVYVCGLPREKVWHFYSESSTHIFCDVIIIHGVRSAESY